MKHIWFAVVCLCLGTLPSALAQTPTIKSFKPTSGPVGTRVNIAGENLINTTGVTFGGGVAATSGAFADTGVSVYVPDGAQTGPITILGSSGNVTTSQDFVVTADPTPPPAPATPTPQPAPVITSAAQASGTMGQPFSYQIEAKGSVSTYGVSEGNLPAGVSVDANSGLISGRPTEYGEFVVYIYARNADGGGSELLTISITSDAPVVNVSAVLSKVRADDGDPATFLFTLSHPASHGTLVHFATFGLLWSSTDASSAQDIVKIPAGKTSKAVRLALILPPGLFLSPFTTKSIKLMLFPSTDNSYNVGTADTAKVKVIKP